MTGVLQLRHVDDERIGRYDLLDTIGVGGMGKVYLAQREGSPDVCVLKRVLVELEERESVQRRFQREAWIATLLDHPGIAKTIDAGFDDDALYIAMEFIGGVDLFDIVKKHWQSGRKLRLDFAVTVMMRALEALAYAHDARGPDGAELSLVHRDLSPKNVMVSFDGGVKIIDFGVAHANLGEHRTKTGMLVGTVPYASPEQAMGHKVDRKSDLYTVAVLLYEMLSGKQLIADGEMREMLRKVVLQEVDPIRSHNPEVPEALASVIERGLAKDAEARWPTASVFREALKAAAPEELAPAALGELVREWFPEAEALALERIGLGRTRYERASGDLPEQFLATKTVPITRSRPVTRSRSPKWIAMPLVGASLMLLAVVIAQRSTPEPEPVPPPMASAPQIVPRAMQPLNEEPAPPVPPPIPPVTKPRSTSKPRPDLDRILARVRRTRTDLLHQHSLDALRARLDSSDPNQVDAAILELQGRLAEIEFERSRLDERVKRIQDLLRRTQAKDKEFLELERRFMDAASRIERVMDPEIYREICAALDALERDLSR